MRLLKCIQVINSKHANKCTDHNVDFSLHKLHFYLHLQTIIYVLVKHICSHIVQVFTQLTQLGYLQLICRREAAPLEEVLHECDQCSRATVVLKLVYTVVY